MSESRCLPLAYELQSAAVARRFVRAYGVEYELGATEAECLIASELVTNAVLHGDAPVALTLDHRDNEVTIDVADGDSRIVAVRERDLAHPGAGGRGLRLVAALAAKWGVRPNRSGKSVWATTDSVRGSRVGGNGRS